ncbi:alpha/beta fold hydrolase [Maribacter sp. 2307UL18-2]|uniref:alpha/beta fold hydrolase n=1 Tax=Maribacter sp. 2307UL18-2 TaxID=3386274 RepID=UPI0039BD8B87
MKTYQFLLLLILAVCYSCGNKANYHFIEIQGKKQHVLTWGKGEPVVVFLNGGGSTLKDFNPVQKEISKTTKTVSYDKPGLGKSELINIPRTLENVTEDLRILIEKESIDGTPLILVGHSMGGAVARFYLHLYPENVLGLVLVDPGSEYLEDEWRKIRSEVELEKEDSLLAAQIQKVSKGFQMEVKAYRQHDSILKTIKLQTDIPVTLLESNKVEEGDEEGKLLLEIQKRLYRDFKESVPQTKLISTKASGHFIQLDEPNLVINAIKEILTKVQ